MMKWKPSPTANGASNELATSIESMATVTTLDGNHACLAHQDGDFDTAMGRFLFQATNKAYGTTAREAGATLAD